MCGIFGRISTDFKKLDKAKFNVLGVANDSRGGDSCGIFIDGSVEYGHDKTKLYLDFMPESELLKTCEESKIALGHCRKASIGEISKSTAQPVCLYNDEEDIDFVLIHNGTIYDYEDLAKKYIPQIDIKGMTDSQVMARIFYHCGYNVLNEYNGAAVFVILDYRNQPKDTPLIYLYKGASRMYESSKDEVSERPLYVSFCGKEIWFSSIPSILDAISYPVVCRFVSPNMLISVSYDKKIELHSIMDIDRSKCIQNKKYHYVSNSYVAPYRSTYQNTRSEDYYKYSGQGNSLVNAYSNTNNDDDNSLWIRDVDVEFKDRVALNSDGLYRKNKDLVHGVHSLTPFGYSPIHKVDYIDTDVYYFYQGRLLPNAEIFTLISQLGETFSLKPEDIENTYPEVIDKYSYIPVVNIIEKDNTIEVYEVIDFDTLIEYTGKICPIFSNTCYQYNFVNSRITNKGQIVKIGDNMNEFREFQNSFKNMNIELAKTEMIEYVALKQEEELEKIIRNEENNKHH